jgi:chromosome partitioning protein
LATGAIIGVWSARARVGKTTLAVDLAWRAAVESGHRALVWDLDPAHGCGWLGTGSARRVRGQPLESIQPTRWPGLSLLPASGDPPSRPGMLARLWPDRAARPAQADLADALRQDYARIILDCPAQPGTVAATAMAAADLVIVPLPPVPDVADLLESARRTILRLTGRHPPILPVLSIVDTRQRLHRTVHEGPAAGWPMIPQASLVHQAAAQHIPVGAAAGWTEASQRLQALSHAIEARLRDR